MKGRKKVLFKDKKEAWLRECLSVFTHYLHNMNDDKVLTAMINEREAIQTSDGHDYKVTPDNVQSVLSHIDAGSGEYLIKDIGRLGGWLLSVGCDEEYLFSMKPSDRMKFDAVIFAALGTVTKKVATYYSHFLNENPDMDPDMRDRIGKDWHAFNEILEKAVTKDCKNKVIALFRDCKLYRDYLAEDIIRQMDALPDEMKVMMQISYYKNSDQRELDIVSVRNDIRVAIDRFATDKENRHYKALLMSVTKYEAVNELMQQPNAKGTPYLLRLAAFQDVFARVRTVIEGHRGNKVIPAALSFWSPKGSEAAKKMEETLSGVRVYSKRK